MTLSLADIATALRAEDIEGLIKLGAPNDEYDSEATEIGNALASLQKDQLTEANIAAIIALAWAKSFNHSAQEIEQRVPAFRRISHRLIDSNRSFK
jgi:hypothetical protein